MHRTPAPRTILHLLAQSLAWLTLSAAMAVPAWAGPYKEARVPHRDKGAFPQFSLRERESRSQRAVDHLGTRLLNKWCHHRHRKSGERH